MAREITVPEYIDELFTEKKILDFPLVKGFGLLADMYLIEETEKYGIARHDTQWKNTPSPHNDYHMNLVYYPKNVDHAQLFVQSPVDAFGPKDEFPGSAAVLQAGYMEMRSGRVTVHTQYTQFCFKQGEPVGITRSIASKYMGARYRLFKSFFSQDIVQMASAVRRGWMELPEAGERDFLRGMQDSGIFETHDLKANRDLERIERR